MCVDNGVIDSVIFYAKKSYPNEFLAMFDGHVKDKVLYITGLLFLPGERSHTGASFNDWLIPPTQRKWGSVHSHPGPSNQPSDADLMTFAKHGPFHIIVCEPYSLATMQAYDSYGNLATFDVGNFEDINQDLVLDDLAEIEQEMKESGELDDEADFDDGDENDENVSSSNMNFVKDNIAHQTNDSSVHPNSPKGNPHNINNDSTVFEINGQRVSAQNPNVDIVIEIPKDGGKPIIKNIIKKNPDDSEE